MKKGLIRLFFITMFLFIIMPIKTYALTFKIEKSVDTIKPNMDVTVYLKATDVTSEDSIQKYKFGLNYDTSKLVYKSSSSDVANIDVSSNPIIVTSNNGTLNSDSIIASIVFGVKNNAKSGDANLTLSSEYVTTISGKELKENTDYTNTSSMVKVSSFSNDATLSSLKIPNTTLSPKFSKDVYEYTCTISDVTEITVNAVAADSNAKIMISDNYKNLVKGENEIKISVTAEDGSTTKNYIVKVNLKLTPTEEELTKADATLSSLAVEDYDIEFDKNQKKYTLTVPYEVKKINILAESTNPNSTIKMDGNTSLKVGRNTINITVTSEDEQNTESYVLTVTRQQEEKKVVQTCPDTTSTKEWIIFSISMALTFTLGIILGYFLCKKEILKKIFRRKNKNEVEKQDEKLSNTIEIEKTKIITNNKGKSE